MRLCGLDKEGMGPCSALHYTIWDHVVHYILPYGAIPPGGCGALWPRQGSPEIWGGRVSGSVEDYGEDEAAVGKGYGDLGLD